MPLNLSPIPSKLPAQATHAKKPSPITFGSNQTDTVTIDNQPNPNHRPKASFNDAFMIGVKAAFNPPSLVFDGVLGTIATILFAFIPPHIQALATLPIWMILGAIIRGVQGFQAAYSGHVTPV